MSNVTHPSHYNSGKIEVIEAIEDWKLNFHRGNTVKYVARAGKKDQTKEIEDLEKARWYLEREIERLKSLKEGRELVRPNDMNPKKAVINKGLTDISMAYHPLSQFKEGQLFKTRNGRCAKITGIDHGSGTGFGHYPVKGVIFDSYDNPIDFRWDETGLAIGAGSASDHDLVSGWPMEETK